MEDQINQLKIKQDLLKGIDLPKWIELLKEAYEEYLKKQKLKRIQNGISAN